MPQLRDDDWQKVDCLSHLQIWVPQTVEVDYCGCCITDRSDANVDDTLAKY